MTDRLEPLAALLDIMARLRDPARGCPWDRAQTFATIAPYTIEEAYEVADVIVNGDIERDGGRQSDSGGEGGGGTAPHDALRLQDELGDLLFQVVFHARLAEERGWFDFGDVARAIGEKLERRHPHVFGEETTRVDAAALPQRWEEQKARERTEAARRRRAVGAAGVGEAAGAGGDVEAAGAATLADVPLVLPALLRAAKLGKRAGRVGFDWLLAKEVRAKVIEELGELDVAVSGAERAAGDAQAVTGDAQADAGDIAEEMGDLLFAVANWGRHLGVEPETALRAANTKFERRFACMERLARERGLTLAALSPAEW
ncbi:MAG: nucleoside triphosphate pyrophosphohydrolase, partial [Steroidobacteraceae bacterium]